MVTNYQFDIFLISSLSHHTLCLTPSTKKHAHKTLTHTHTRTFNQTIDFFEPDTNIPTHTHTHTQRDTHAHTRDTTHTHT